MTRKLCFLGNSHIAAFKEAWTENPGRWPQFDADFVGMHGDLLLQTRIADGHLWPDSTDAAEALDRLSGRVSVDIANCDGFVVTGCNVSVALAVMLRNRMRWPGLPSLTDLNDLASLRQILASKEAATATLQAMLNDRLGLRLVRHLAKVTNGPVWLAAQPRLSAKIVEGRPPNHAKGHLRALIDGDGPTIVDFFQTVVARTVADAGGVFLPQPADTVTMDLLTAVEYATGATRLAPSPGVPQPARDILHANAAYGARVLDQIVSALMDQ